MSVNYTWLCLLVLIFGTITAYADGDDISETGRSSSYNFLSMFGWPKNNNDNNGQTSPCYTTTTPPPSLPPCPLTQPQQLGDLGGQGSQLQPQQKGGLNGQGLQFQPQQMGGFNGQGLQFQPQQMGGFNGQGLQFQPQQMGGLNGQGLQLPPQQMGDLSGQGSQLQPQALPNDSKPNGLLPPETSQPGINMPSFDPSKTNVTGSNFNGPLASALFGGPISANGGNFNNNGLPLSDMNSGPTNEIYMAAQDQQGLPAEGLIAFQPAGMYPGQIQVVDAKTGKPIFPWPAGLANQLQQMIPLPQLPDQPNFPKFPQAPNVQLPNPEMPMPDANKPALPTMPDMPNVPSEFQPQIPKLPEVPAGNTPNMPSVPQIPGIEIPSYDFGSNYSIPPGGSPQEPIALPSVAVTSKPPVYIPLSKDQAHGGFLPIPPLAFMPQQYAEPSSNIPIINLPFPVNPIQTCTGLPPGPFTPPGFFHTDSKVQLQRSTEKNGLSPVTPVSCTMLQVFEQLRLRTIYNLIVKSGAELFFQESYNYTFFAPVDAAFDRLPAWFMQELQTDFLLQKAFIKNHFVKIDLPLESLGNEFLVLNLRGSRLRVNIYNPDTDYKVYTVDGARILLGGVKTTNGLLHIVDKVLMPIPNRNHAQYLGEVKDFSNFLNAVTNAGMLPEFQEENPKTVFIPYDPAFKSFDLISISSDQKALRNLVNYHIVNGTWFSAGLIHGQYLTTNYFKEIKMGISTDGFTKYAETVNGKIRVIKSDIPLLNGVAHIIENCITYDPNFFFYEELSEFASEFSSFRRSMTLNKKELEKDFVNTNNTQAQES